jgi:hypothetical protein
MKTIKDRTYSFHHTRDRLKERYGIDLDMEGYDFICHKVQNTKDRSLIATEHHKDDTQYIYDLAFHFRGDIRVVWSEKRQCITTVLKRDK